MVVVADVSTPTKDVDPCPETEKDLNNFEISVSLNERFIALGLKTRLYDLPVTFAVVLGADGEVISEFVLKGPVVVVFIVGVKLVVALLGEETVVASVVAPKNFENSH